MHKDYYLEHYRIFVNFCGGQVGRHEFYWNSSTGLPCFNITKIFYINRLEVSDSNRTLSLELLPWIPSFQKYSNKLALMNLFHATGLFSYTLKTSENLWVSDIFRGSRKRPVGWNATMKNFQVCTQPAITCSKLPIETLEQGVKYVQS